LEKELNGSVRWKMKSFLLRPEESPNRTFTEYHLAHRARANAQDGAPRFDLPPVGTRYPSSSFPALEAAKWVEENAPKKFEDYDLALFEAFFGRSEDISDLNLLVREAERFGIDGASLRDALTSHAMRATVIEEFREAAQTYDISAVPAVIIPNQPPIIGAVPVETYREVVYADHERSM
jgi:predicted DsbA family dithiol-disulfide isomerase